MADGSQMLGSLMGAPQAEGRAIRIGLVNNMPDTALAATERQFAGLLAQAAGGRAVSLSLFSLAGVARSETTAAAMAGRYGGLEALKAAELDAIIVTGAEPKATTLPEEAYWGEMGQLIDWARAGGVGASLWSCLGAHAAVLHMDGIERQRLPVKCSGLYLCERVSDDAMAQGLPEMVRMPHSRRNGLPVGELAARGYHLITESREAGADVFVRREAGLMLFFQGHPEYDADTLLREYCRDFARWIRGEQARPALPVRYLDAATERALTALADEAARDPHGRMVARCGSIANAFTPPHAWRAHAERLMANWVGEIVHNSFSHREKEGAQPHSAREG